MLSQRGNHVFLFFLWPKLIFFSGQRGPWPNAPLNTPLPGIQLRKYTPKNYTYVFSTCLHKILELRHIISELAFLCTGCILDNVIMHGSHSRWRHYVRVTFSMTSLCTGRILDDVIAVRGSSIHRSPCLIRILNRESPGSGNNPSNSNCISPVCAVGCFDDPANWNDWFQIIGSFWYLP